MNTPATSARSAYLLLALVLGVLAYLYGFYQHDSRMFRTGAELCGPNLYKYEAQSKVQGVQSLGTPFFRAPFYAWALRQLARTGDFRLAFLLVSLAAAAFVAVWLPRGLDLKWNLPLAPVLLFFPLVLNFLVEQDGAIMLAIFVGALMAARRGHDLTSGVLLALTLQKPSAVLLVPVCLLLSRKWRILAGYLVAGGALGVFSLALVGTGAIHDYLDLIHRYPVAAWRMPNARGLAAGLSIPLLWPLAAVVGVAATAWASRNLSFSDSMSAALVGSLLVSPQSYAHDLYLLTPSVTLAAFGASRWHKAMALVWAVPFTSYFFALPLPWCAVGGLAVLALLLSHVAGARRERLAAPE